MRIQLSDHFTYGRLLRFCASPILMMVFTSFYSIVDGFFVSNFVGKTPFAAVNLMYPVTMIPGAVGFMIGTGGSAVVAITLGEGKRENANRYFTMMIWVAGLVGLFLGLAGAVFTPQIAELLGASGQLKDYCVTYGRILFIANPLFILQCTFQNFFVAAEKPQYSFWTSVAAGVTNAVLDFLFIVVFQWGLVGAALATALGQAVGTLIPLIYFIRENDSLLRLTRFQLDGPVLFRTFTNGSSEMVSNLSMSLVNILYNFQVMRFAGENGVAAYGVIMYVNFAFTSIFLGYSLGSAPLVSFHYGAGNHNELKNLFRKSLVLLSLGGVIMTALAEVSALPLVEMFTGYDRELSELTSHGFRIYAAAFLVMGVNIWSSAFFTALGNGLVSAILSFLRTLFFQVAAVLLLPVFLGLNGVWLAIVVAEGAALLVAVWCFGKKRGEYRY